jgi:hypothetical protein
MADCQEGSAASANNITPWTEYTSEIYLPSDHRLSAKLAPTFADIGCHVVSVTDPYGHIRGLPKKLGKAAEP